MVTPMETYRRVCEWQKSDADDDVMIIIFIIIISLFHHDIADNDVDVTYR